MTKDDMLEMLQGDAFDMEEAFYSDLGGEVTAEYTLMVTDAEALLNSLGIDLESVDDYDSLHDEVENGLNDSFDGGVDGVATY